MRRLDEKKLDPTPATGVDPYSRATIGTTPSGRDPGPTGADKKDTVYKGIDFRIPQSVKKAAEKGLEMREFNIKNGQKSRPGGTGIGVARARWLRDQKEGHPRGIKRTAAFTQGGPPDKLRDEKGRPTPGYVAYMLWGGDAARAWAGRIVKQMKAADEKEKAAKAAKAAKAKKESAMSGKNGLGSLLADASALLEGESVHLSEAAAEPPQTEEDLKAALAGLGLKPPSKITRDGSIWRFEWRDGWKGSVSSQDLGTYRRGGIENIEITHPPGILIKGLAQLAIFKSFGKNVTK